jgi:hypothetical protein
MFMGVLAILVLLVILIVLSRPGPEPAPATDTAGNAPVAPVAASQPSRSLTPGHMSGGLPSAPVRPAEEIVAEKLRQFTRHHENLVAAMAKHHNVAVPPEVTRLFAAVAAGNWQETTNLFATLRQLRSTENAPPGLDKLWPAILETYGVAEQTQKWPAQQLLNYGNSILDSLRPGMIYVGGNDAGRFIPTLLSETSDGEPHIVLTQNGLADGSYLEYLRYRFGDKLNTLSSEDSQKSFQTYIADAQKRLQHDQEFPNEPKQVLPGEDIRMTDGRVQVGGQIAVMAINEELLRTLLQKNPNASFALEESFPLKSLYAGATTLGPITELRATDGASALTPERAEQSLDYWRTTTQSVLAETETASPSREAYTKMILGQAGLFEQRQLNLQAEQAFQLATTLSPGNPEAVLHYVKMLTEQQRLTDARQVVQNAVTTAPENPTFRALKDQLDRMK